MGMRLQIQIILNNNLNSCQNTKIKSIINLYNNNNNKIPINRKLELVKKINTAYTNTYIKNNNLNNLNSL